jgi:hypothetical protein
MIRWCAYCQRFLGEFEPYDSLDTSHGICPSCVTKGVIANDDDLSRSAALRSFFADLRKLALSGAASMRAIWFRRRTGWASPPSIS